MSIRTEKFTVKEESSLLDFLVAQYPQSSKTSLKKMIIHGSIEINGKSAKNPAIRVIQGDEVVYRKQSVVPMSGSPFRLFFEDDHILVLDKPAGILTYGEKGSSGSSVYKEMKEYLGKIKRSRADLFVVHRLDREVSGLLLFAKSLKIQETLKDNWKEFTKKYQALVEGILKPGNGTINSWLSDGAGYKVHSGREREGAKYAETKYQILKVMENHTLVELQLVTGRKNQLRVHLSDLGHPVVGDVKYGADERWKRRIRLHACYLRIKHPQNGEWMEFHSELPKGFFVLRPEHEKYKYRTPDFVHQK